MMTDKSKEYQRGYNEGIRPLRAFLNSVFLSMDEKETIISENFIEGYKEATNKGAKMLENAKAFNLAKNKKSRF